MVHSIPKGICSKVSTIACLEFEHALCGVAIKPIVFITVFADGTLKLSNNEPVKFWDGETLGKACFVSNLRPDLVCLFYSRSAFMGYLMAKPFCRRFCYYLSYSWWEDEGFHTFHKGIRPNVNIITWLDFKLAYYDVTLLHVRPYVPWQLSLNAVEFGYK